LDEAKQSPWLDLIINQEHIVFLLSRQIFTSKKIEISSSPFIHSPHHVNTRAEHPR
jgi:hypothetical protein